MNSDIDILMLREGINPSHLSLEQVIRLNRAMAEDPPIRYRLDWWFYLIASILYAAHGGKGQVPTPPWMKVEQPQADQEALKETVLALAKSLEGLSNG